MTCRRAIVSLLIGPAAVVWMSRATLAEAPPADRPATRPTHSRLEFVSKAFTELADPNAAVREAARTQLLKLDRSDLVLLRDVVRDARPLAPMQAEALHEIVVHVWLKGEHFQADVPAAGFMGIRAPGNLTVALAQEPGLDENISGAGVPVGEMIPGFAAYEVLRPGDVVIALHSAQFVRLKTWPDLQQSVAKHPPGHTLRFEVLRQGQVRQVPIRLSARPSAVAEPSGVGTDAFLNDRQQKAEAYWTDEFEPLLTDPPL